MEILKNNLPPEPLRSAPFPIRETGLSGGGEDGMMGAGSDRPQDIAGVATRVSGTAGDTHFKAASPAAESRPRT